MIKSITSLIFFMFFCSVLAAVLNSNNSDFRSQKNYLTNNHPQINYSTLQINF